MIFLGCDPGKMGAIASMSEDGSVRTELFSEKSYIDFIRNEIKTTNPKETFCILERVHSSPQMGVSSSFSFGQNFGFIQGVLKSFEIPYELVLPQKWKRFFGATADKNTSVAIASRLFPDVDLRATERCKKPHDGKAEALLMAEYARRIYNSK